MEHGDPLFREVRLGGDGVAHEHAGVPVEGVLGGDVGLAAELVQAHDRDVDVPLAHLPGYRMPADGDPFAAVGAVEDHLGQGVAQRQLQPLAAVVQAVDVLVHAHPQCALLPEHVDLRVVHVAVRRLVHQDGHEDHQQHPQQKEHRAQGELLLPVVGQEPPPMLLYLFVEFGLHPVQYSMEAHRNEARLFGNAGLSTR